MVSYEIPRPPRTRLERARDSIKLAAAFFKGDKVTVDNITAATIFSPLQPLRPLSPQMAGRNWDYQPGLNIQFLPRGYGSGRIPFVNLRNLSRNCEILRLVIETRKDQIGALEWQIVAREGSNVSDDDPRITEVQNFLQRPDRIHDWDEWVRMVMEELFVTDAVSIYRPRTKALKSKPYAFEVIDGATIKPVIDSNGRRPVDPTEPAFQQILKGAPRVDYTIEELLYAPRNLLPYDPVYGYSQTEQTLISCETSLNRSRYQLEYFKSGSVPDAYCEMPANMTPDAIMDFEERFNNILSGNAQQRYQVPFLPQGSKIAQMKATVLKDDFDEWMARIICFAFSLPPNAFTRQMNRATAESEKERALEEGLAPLQKWLKKTMDYLICNDFGYADLEFTWKDDKEQDQTAQAEIEDKNVRNGTMTINEIRAGRGLDPVEGGDAPMFATATGYVPLDSFETIQATAQAQAAATTARLQAQPNGNQTDGSKTEPKAGSNVAGKLAYKRHGKAVRHPAIPLSRPAVARASSALTAKIQAILDKTADSVVHQAKQHFKITKDDSNDDFSVTVDLTTLNLLATTVVPELDAVANDSAKQTLLQIGIENESGLVNQVNADSLAYAKKRGAEMVGKKWVDGELVDNPNADWVITDATRDELRSLVADVESGDLKLTDLPSAIKDAGAFSKERAAMIARTEIMAANAQGGLAGFKLAQSLGVKVQKAWDVDEDPCPICEANGDQGAIDLDDDFDSGDDAPPAHPNCECVLVSVVDESEESDSSDDEDEGD